MSCPHPCKPTFVTSQRILWVVKLLCSSKPLLKTSADGACFLLQNAEIFTLTYGSMVRQLISDLEDVNEVNKQLDTM